MRRQLALIFAVPSAAALVAACGMVTGLSDDFTFDGGEAGGGDGSVDGAADTGGGTDAGPDARDSGLLKCTGDNQSTANQALQSATESCRSCLVGSCCNVVALCAKSGGGDCANRLGCEALCASRTSTSSRSACMQSCTSDKPSITFTQGVLPCAQNNCNDECGFQ